MSDLSLSPAAKAADRRTQQKIKKLHADWGLKSSAGAVLGFSLALACSGLFAWWGPGGIDAENKVQFNMWLIPIIWMPVFSVTYLFRTGWQAIGWLAGFNLLAYGLLLVARQVPVLP